MQLDLLPTIQQAISNLLTVYEPEFLRFGHGLFLALATHRDLLGRHSHDAFR